MARTPHATTSDANPRACGIELPIRDTSALPLTKRISLKFPVFLNQSGAVQLSTKAERREGAVDLIALSNLRVSRGP